MSPFFSFHDLTIDKELSDFPKQSPKIDIALYYYVCFYIS